MIWEWLMYGLGGVFLVMIPVLLFVLGVRIRKSGGNGTRPGN